MTDEETSNEPMLSLSVIHTHVLTEPDEDTPGLALFLLIGGNVMWANITKGDGVASD